MAKNTSKSSGKSALEGIEFGVDLDTSQAKKSLKDLGNEIVKTGKKGDQALVSDKQSSRMRGFNERTEKMRQIVQATGVGFGGAAGSAIYYTGTLTAMAGTFGKLELAMFGATAVLAVVGTVIMNAYNEANKWKDILAESEKVIEQFGNQIDSASESIWNQIHGIDKYESSLNKMNMELLNAQAALSMLKQQADKYADSSFMGGDLGAMAAKKYFDEQAKKYTELQDKIAAYRKKADEARALEQIVTNREQLARIVDFGNKENEKEKEKNKRLLEANKRMLDQKAQQYMAANRDWISDEWRFQEDYANGLREARESRRLDELESSNNMIALKYQEGQILLEHERQYQEEQKKNRLQAIGMADTMVGAFGQLADMTDMFGEQSAKTAEQQKKAEAKRVFAFSILNAGVQAALAWAHWATPPLAFAHATAAAMLLASAAKAASMGGGGGGGGGGSRGASPSGAGVGVGSGGSSQNEQTQSPVVVNINGGVFGSDAGRVINQLQAEYQQSQNPGRATGGF